MLKRAYIAADPVDAEMVKGLLEGHNIFAVIKGDFAWNARGETPVTDDTAPAVWVHEEDFQAARAAIDARANQTKLPDWRCPNCGEQLDGQFMQCWNCGTQRKTPKADEDMPP